MHTEPHTPRRRWSLPAALRGAWVLMLLALAFPAQAQTRVAAVNALYDSIRPQDRSDRVILPAVAQMRPPPPGVETINKARLQFVGSGVWDAASAWAREPAQIAVLEKLDEITRETDYRVAMAFGQPYGIDQLEDIDLIEAGLYTELDVAGSPLLAGARPLYLNKLKWVGCLVHVEATRRAGQGDLAGALDVVGDWIFFSRQLADREFANEMVMGMAWMLDGLERSRDIVYDDFMGDRVLAGQPGVIGAFIDRLAERTRDGQQAYLGIERLTLPRANRLAGLQLAETVLTEAGGASPAFGPTMAALASAGRPMRQFAEIPRWNELASSQGTTRGVVELLEGVQSDMDARWDLHDPFDPIMSQPFQLTRIASQRTIIIALTLGQLEGLFDLIQQLRTETIGTRQALGQVAYSYRYGAFAPSATSIRPVWLVELAPDPLRAPDRGVLYPMQFFVPGRDTPGATHDMSIVESDGFNFSKSFKSDAFIVYSVGTDSQPNWAKEVQNTMDVVFGADYLIWPPLLSLTREELRRRGDLR